MPSQRDLLLDPIKDQEDAHRPLEEWGELRNSEDVRLEQLADLIISIYLEWKQQ